MKRNIPWYCDAEAFILAVLILCGFTLAAQPARADQPLVIEICGAGAIDPSASNTCAGSSAANVDQPGGVTLGTEFDGIRVSDPNSGKTLQLPVTPASALNTPAGWSSPTSPPSSAGSPTVKYSVASFGCSGNLYDTASAAASACAASIGGTVEAVCNVSGSDYFVLHDPTPGATQPTCNAITGTAISHANTCPSGYSISGGTCVLTSAPDVVKPSDNGCGVKRSGATLTFDSQDPDCSAPPMNVSCSAGVCTGSGGAGDSFKYTANSDGSGTLVRCRPQPDGTTVCGTYSGTAPDGSGKGKVNGTASATTAGTGTLNTPGSPVSQTSVTGQCGGPGQPECSVKVDETGTPTTFANQSDAATAVATLKSHADAAATSGLGSFGVPGASTFGAPTGHEQGTFFNALFPSSSSCAPITFASAVKYGANSGDLTLDICPVVAVALPILDWLLFGLTCWYVYSVFWRRKAGV